MCREGLSAYLLLQSTRQGKLFLWPATEAYLYLRGGDGAVPRPSCAQAGERGVTSQWGWGPQAARGMRARRTHAGPASRKSGRSIDACSAAEQSELVRGQLHIYWVHQSQGRGHRTQQHPVWVCLTRCDVLAKGSH